jgi:flavin reductase (DIM6/NTAB) family NADH-FMN oxidoreductase RutF
MMSASIDPPMFAISIGIQRYSLEVIRTAGEFVISLPSATMAEAAVLFGTKSGRDIDKLAASGLATQPASQVDTVLLSDAVANYECRLESEHPAGDHVIFVGRLLAAHVNTDTSVQRLYTLGDDRMGGVSP